MGSIPIWGSMKTEITNLFEARKNKKLMRVLFSLTLRGHSEMRFTLHSIYGEYEKDCVIILAKKNQKIIGWALVYLNCAHFYVAHAFRRKGVGTILYNKAKEVCGDHILCSAWDKVSTRFFTKNKAKLYGAAWQDTISSSLMDIYLS